MARTDALSILSNQEQDQLAEVYGATIESIQKMCLSEQIKNTNYSGTPTAGSVEIARFSNAVVADYGTARAAGEGTKIDNSGKVTININTHKEIVEEIEEIDLDLHGVKGIAQKRMGNQVKRISAYLDRLFFNKAKAEGTKLTIKEGTIVNRLEALIQSLETTENKWVDGVDRDMLVLTLTPKVYSLIRDHLDIVTNPNIDSSVNEFRTFRGVKVYSNHRQTVDAICMIDGAIAQPVWYKKYDMQNIQMSAAIGLINFFSSGTKAVMPDLIKYVEDIQEEEE